MPNYVEPFFGSGAVLLQRPKPFDGTETVNDLDGMVANYWRATQADPDAVAHHADWPVNENDLHARHIWLVNRKAELQARLEGDADYYDVRAAGWWLWGICSWIGSGWCSGNGPWQSVDGQLVHLGAGPGVSRQLVHLGDAGRGVNRKLDDDTCEEWSEHLRTMMRQLRDRLRRVRVCCGDWSRVCGPAPTERLGLTAVFLDPPYSTETGRDMTIYAEDSGTVAHDVREWALAHGNDPLYRIALCGYEGEHDLPGWDALAWKANGGYGSQGEGRGRANAHREVVWFSPHCLGARQPRLL